MCSISGFAVLGSSAPDRGLLSAAFHEIFRRGTVRGKDSFGIAAISQHGEVRTFRGFGLPDSNSVLDLLDDVSIVLANTRAIPTTEWIKDRDGRTIQPFSGAGWYVTHNGTIANDREIALSLGLNLQLQVDSAVLPWLLAEYDAADAFSLLQGSFALAAADVRQPRRLVIARNFKPLCLMEDRRLGCVFFASLPEQLLAENVGQALTLARPHIESLPPYSYAVLDSATNQFKVRGLSEGDHPQRRALVIASGGLDSTVAATLLRREGYDITLLHFTYGCHAEASELLASREVAKALRCDHRVVPLDWLGRLGASSLTIPGSTITSCEVGAEYPHEWVPARNMLMIAHACAIADAERFTHIALGTNLEEGGSYPDNTQEFISYMNKASILGTLSRAQVIAPIGNLVKHEIVRLGCELSAPLHLTWSCYLSGDRHCGRCGPCFMRRVAFEANGLADPVAYASQPLRLRPVLGRQLGGSPT